MADLKHHSDSLKSNSRFHFSCNTKCAEYMFYSYPVRNIKYTFLHKSSFYVQYTFSVFEHLEYLPIDLYISSKYPFQYLFGALSLLRTSPRN